MFKKKCRCGKTEKNFKVDIGPWFINECCKKAGYDVYGEMKGKPEAPKDEPKKDEPTKAEEKAADVNKDGQVDEKDLSIVHKVFSSSKKKAKKKSTRKKRTKKSDKAE